MWVMQAALIHTCFIFNVIIAIEKTQKLNFDNNLSTQMVLPSHLPASPYWGNNHLEPHTQHSTAFLFNILSSCLYLFLKTMVIILVALKLIEKGTMCNIFRIFPFNIALLKFIYVAIISLYFIWILACIPLDDYTTVYPPTLLSVDIWVFPSFLYVQGKYQHFCISWCTRARIYFICKPERVKCWVAGNVTGQFYDIMPELFSVVVTTIY